MISTVEQKFENDKNPKRKNQNFKVNQKGNMAFGQTENIKAVNKQKSSFEILDFKDFPALKVPGKFSSDIKPVNKEIVPTVSYNLKKTPIESSVAVPDSKNEKKDTVDLVTSEKQLTQPTAENNIAVKLDKSKGKKGNFSKKASVQVQRNPNKKKRSDPIFINFQDIVTINELRRKTKQHNIVRNSPQRFRDKELLSGNPLDSSSPKRSRGKHREIKKEKLSNLKLTIIKERIIKQKMKEKLSEDPQFENNFCNLTDTIDFDKEIDIYLNELKQKKLKYLGSNSKKLSEVKSLVQESVKSESKSVQKTEEDTKKVTTNIKENLSPTAEVELKFSSKFREYCDNIITPNLNATVTVLIKELITLQDRLFLKDPIKAKARKRHVSGIREVKKYLNLKKVKMIIIPPNLEKLQMKGSVYDSINQLKSLAESQNVPYGFALDRYKLGKCTKKNVPISAFAILNYEGIEALYDNVLSELLEAKRKFSELEGTKKEEKADDINSQVISSLISVFRTELKM